MPLKRVEKSQSETSGSEKPDGGFLDDLMPFIKKGTVIPIISNSIRIDHIFNDEESLMNLFSDSPQFTQDAETITEELTKVWAEYIHYPMADANNLPRVAQFYQVELKDLEKAKLKYLEFLSDYLLDLEKDGDYKDDVAQLRRQNASFSKIAKTLDHPRFPSGDDQDPLRILAKLPLKIYITTSHFNFMEQALEAVGRHPRTEVCYWTKEKISSTATHTAEPNYTPPDDKSEEEEPPVVYHLFGIEEEPKTLVLSEDDNMNFLISVVQDTNTNKPVVPLWLREGLAESRLLLLGYRVRDWDFRVLFRFILNYRNDSAPRGMFIQLEPGGRQAENKEKSVEYMGNYFDKKQFDVDWTNPEKFILKLWNEWDKYRKGQS